MMVGVSDMSYEPFMHIDLLRERGTGAATINYDGMGRVGAALKSLKASRNPINAGKLAWRAKGLLEDYDPKSEGDVRADAQYLLGVAQPRTLFCMFEMVGTEYVRKYSPKKDMISEGCRECIYDRFFGEWIRENREIKTVDELVDYALALEASCGDKKRNLSACLEGNMKKLLDNTKDFADCSLKTESMKAIANAEATNILSEKNRVLKGGRKLGFDKPKDRKVYITDPEARSTREARSKRIELIKTGFSNAADELDVKIVKPEDLGIPDYENLQI